MLKKEDLVEEQFPRYNCSQTVFSIFAEDVGLDKKTALRLASCFGGGMGCASTCGAVTGAYMVIGMKHGYHSSDPEAKAKIKWLTRLFNEKFISEHKTLICRELTGFDISTSEGSAAAHEADVFSKKCTGFIKTACNILENDLL